MAGAGTDELFEKSVIKIDDTRLPKEFVGISFSGFKKTQVCRELLRSLMASKLEAACYWTAELVCAGHYELAWETVVQFYAKYVHLASPYVSLFLAKRWGAYLSLVSSAGGITNANAITLLDLRNSATLRQLMTEMVCVVVLSKRSVQSLDNMRISRGTDLQLEQLVADGRFRAPHAGYIPPAVLREDDTPELVIPLNELAYSVHAERRNVLDACFWVEWLMAFDGVSKETDEERPHCEPRYLVSHISVKYQSDIIWIVWEILLHAAEQVDTVRRKLVDALMQLFAIHYTSACYGRKKWLVYMAIMLVCEPPLTSWQSSRILSPENREQMMNALKNIDRIYARIKRSEYAAEEFNYLVFEPTTEHNT